MVDSDFGLCGKCWVDTPFIGGLVCDACGTPYHPSCFEESGGCAVYGCANLTARSTSGRIQHPRRPHRAARLKAEDAAPTRPPAPARADEASP